MNQKEADDQIRYELEKYLSNKGNKRSLKESNKEPQSVVDITSEFIYQLLMNLFVLFIGYIITLLM